MGPLRRGARARVRWLRQAVDAAARGRAGPCARRAAGVCAARVRAAPPPRRPTVAPPTAAPPTAAPPEPDKPPAARPPEPAPEDQPAAPLTKQQPPELSDAEKALAKAKRKEFWGLVNAGRGLVRKDKDYAGGIAKYEAALAVLPNHPTALAEIGYAHLLAGSLDEAERFTSLALAQETSYRLRGMLHYNRGQVLEKQGDPRGALNEYRSSWAARHNDTVKARIDELKSQIGASPRKTFKALAAVCKQVKAEWDCDSGPDSATCRCGTRFVGPAETGIGRAAILRVSGEGMGVVDAEYLVVEAKADDWRLVGQVTNGYSPGAFGIFNSGEIHTLELRPLAAGEGAMLVLVAENSSQDSDLGMNAVTESGSWTLTLCGLDGAALKCLSVPLGKREGVSKIDADGDTPPEDIYGKLATTAWRAEATFDGQGHVTIAVVEGAIPDDLKDLVGTYPLAALAEKPGVSVVDL
ncbi:MAG: tetratricopeptide repeat protein [Myxococcota bacterium]